MAKVIGVFSGKGGAGKTTVAINLGSILAKKYGKRVTLLDCNLTTAHVGLHLGMYNYHATLNHVLRDENRYDEALYDHHSGMKIMPSAISVVDVKGVDVDKLGSVVKSLDSTNDVIILDAAPGLGREAYSAFKASQYALYVSNPHLPSIVDILRCQTVANELGVKPLGIALNMLRNDKHEMKKSEIEYLTDLPVISMIPYDKHVRRSLAQKTPVVLLKPNSSASREMNRLAAQLVGAPVPAKRRFGLFRRR